MTFAYGSVCGCREVAGYGISISVCPNQVRSVLPSSVTLPLPSPWEVDLLKISVDCHHIANLYLIQRYVRQMHQQFCLWCLKVVVRCPPLPTAECRNSQVKLCTRD